MSVMAATATALPPGPGVWSIRGWLMLHRFVFRPDLYYPWLRRTYGDLVTVISPHVTFVLALTAERARQVLTANPAGYDAFQRETFVGLTGPGSLWVLGGARHRQERRLLAPAFNAQRVPDYGQMIADVTARHLDSWTPGQQFRAYDAILAITRDIILRLLFGLTDGPNLSRSRAVVAKLTDEIEPLISFAPAYQSWWYRPWRRYRPAWEGASSFILDQIAERRARPAEVDDVLGLLMMARYDDDCALTDEEIRDEIITILLSGHETSAVALSWAVYELGRHPSVLSRLREELDALGPNPPPDLIVKQSYLAAVCNETLRLHTVLTEIARLVREPQEIGGYVVPPGLGAGVGIWAIHHDPDLYPEPYAFRPERFLERSYGQYELMPFGGGHRRCMGAALADIQLKITLASIVTRWDVEVTGRERDGRHNIGMGPMHGVRVRVKGRRRAA